MKLRLGFLYWTVLTFWNTSGGYLTKTFNSDFERWLLVIINTFESWQSHPKDIVRNIQNLIEKWLLGGIYWNPKIIGIVKVLLGIITTITK